MEERAREASRQRCQALHDALRDEPLVPTAAFELLGLLIARLDRLECGGSMPEEAPTKPTRRATPQVFPAPPHPSSSHFAAVADILEEGKRKP